MTSLSRSFASHVRKAVVLLPLALCLGACSGGADVSPDAASADAAVTFDADTTPDAVDPAEALQQCLFDNCGTELGACIGDTECSGWLTCNQQCDEDDRMLCPTICGWYYQSPQIQPFAACMFDNECVVQDYSSFPACDAPTTAEPDDLAGLDGEWWLTRHVSEDYALTSDCQKLTLDEISPTEINVISTAPLTLNGEEKICQLVGTYRQADDGTIRAEYSTSYVDYFEKWTLVHKSANAFLVDICFGSPASPFRRYGTWLFTRTPVDQLESAERAAIDDAANAALGYDVDDMSPVAMTGCPNE